LAVGAVVPFEPAQAQSAEALKRQCLEEADLQRRVDICTAAIETGTLSDEDRSYALAMRGSAYLQQTWLGKARRDIEEAQRLNPGSPTLVELTAMLEAAEGQAGQRRAAMHQAYEQCRRTGDPAKRLEACDRLLDFAGGSPSASAKAYDLRAFTKAELFDPAGALGDLDMAVKLMPEEPSFREHRMRALFWVGRYEEALPGLEQLSMRDPSNEVLAEAVATGHYALGDSDAALRIFRTMIGGSANKDVPSLRAATIQSELDGADAFASLDPTTSWLSSIIAYRMSRLDDHAFRSAIASQLPNPQGAACLSEFHVGHKAALAKDAATAKATLLKAVENCGFREFEFHAAKKWLKTLGG
jgi:tetratricopeptide (TPR) repeat protein